MILAIESAVAGGSVSFLKNGEAVIRWEGNSDVSRAEDLLPTIEATMSENGISRSDLSMLAVSAGPGSFTGIRIGLSTALGLATGLSLPVASTSVLRAMSSTAIGESVLAAVPMGRGAVCVQVFDTTRGAPRHMEGPVTVTEAEFAHRVNSAEGDVVVQGSLANLCGRTVINLGLDLATVVGKYCHQYPDERETPLFISKSF
jgi:tRNA threonylcarbamoyladenosine biosynthesis protein TsaB